MAKEKPKDTLGEDILDALMRIGAGVITGGQSELAQIRPSQQPREIAPVSPRSRLAPVDAPAGYEPPLVGPPTWREQGEPSYTNRWNKPPPYVDPFVFPDAPISDPLFDATERARAESHPAGGYYGDVPHGEEITWRGRPDRPTPEGSQAWWPGYQRSPLRPSDEFYPPPTISAEDQEEMDRRENLIRAITESLKETVKTENRAAKKKGKK